MGYPHIFLIPLQICVLIYWGASHCFRGKIRILALSVGPSLLKNCYDVPCRNVWSEVLSVEGWLSLWRVDLQLQTYMVYQMGLLMAMTMSNCKLRIDSLNACVRHWTAQFPKNQRPKILNFDILPYSTTRFDGCLNNQSFLKSPSEGVAGGALPPSPSTNNLL